MLMAKLLAGIGCAASWSPSALARKTMTHNVKTKVVPLRTIKAAKRPKREQRNEANSIHLHDERLLSVVARSASLGNVNISTSDHMESVIAHLSLRDVHSLACLCIDSSWKFHSTVY